MGLGSLNIVDNAVKVCFDEILEETVVVHDRVHDVPSDATQAELDIIDVYGPTATLSERVYWLTDDMQAAGAAPWPVRYLVTWAMSGWPMVQRKSCNNAALEAWIRSEYEKHFPHKTAPSLAHQFDELRRLTKSGMTVGKYLDIYAGGYWTPQMVFAVQSYLWCLFQKNKTVADLDSVWVLSKGQLDGRVTPIINKYEALRRLLWMSAMMLAQLPDIDNQGEETLELMLDLNFEELDRRFQTETLPKFPFATENSADNQ